MEFGKIYWMFFNNLKEILPIMISFGFALVCLVYSFYLKYLKRTYDLRQILIMLVLSILSASYAFGFLKYLIVFILYSIAAYFCGHLMLTKFIRLKDRGLISEITKFLIGFYTFGMIFFIFYHRYVTELLGLNISRYVIVFFLLFFLYYGIKHRYYETLYKAISIDANNVITFFIMALLISYFIVFHYNNVLPWGVNFDKNDHIIKLFHEEIIRFKGYPFETLIPFAFQNAINIPNAIIDMHSKSLLIGSYNYFGFINLWIIMIVPYICSKEILKLNENYSNFSSILTLFFGAIGGPFINAYLGFFNISTTMYHNTTTFFSIPLMQIFFYYLCKYLKIYDIKHIFISIFLLDISFFIKPNAYMMLAPFICILLLVLFLKKKVGLIACFKLFLFLVLPTIFWTLYPYLFDIKKLSTNLGISFGKVLFHNFDELLPSLAQMGSLYKLVFISILSLAGIILSTLTGTIKNKEIHDFYFYVLFPLYLMSIIISFVFVENNSRMYHGNFFWQIPLIGMCLMPYISLLVNNIKNRLLRRGIQAVLIFHIISGIWHLIIFDILGRLT